MEVNYTQELLHIPSIDVLWIRTSRHATIDTLIVEVNR